MKATDKEKAVIFALAAGGVDDWKTAYILSRETPEIKSKKESNLKSIVTRWKQRPEIVNAYNIAAAVLEARDKRNHDAGKAEVLEELKQQTAGDSEHPATRKAGKVDYYNPDNQRETINKIIQAASDDPKTQLDAIKVIQQTQRDDRQAAKDNQIQRFFTPVTCQICPLYAKKAKKSV